MAAHVAHSSQKTAGELEGGKVVFYYDRSARAHEKKLSWTAAHGGDGDLTVGMLVCAGIR